MCEGGGKRRVGWVEYSSWLNIGVGFGNVKIVGIGYISDEVLVNILCYMTIIELGGAFYEQFSKKTSNRFKHSLIVIFGKKSMQFIVWGTLGLDGGLYLFFTS